MYAPRLSRKPIKIEVLFKTEPKSNVLGTYKIDFTGVNLNLKVDGQFLFISYSDEDLVSFTTKVFNLNEISAYKEYYEPFKNNITKQI